jgi:inhibitor of cysteine peptidase
MKALAHRAFGAALAIPALLGAILLGLAQSSTAETRALARGASYTLTLQGNPSTGYRWRLDAAKSENAAILKIEDLGYAQTEPPSGEKRRVGAPASYRFRITGVLEGTAKLIFEYVQPWVGKPGKIEEQTVHVRGQ